MAEEKTQSREGAASRLFGRRKGRPLRVRKTHLMETFLPQVRIMLPEQGQISIQEIFNDAAPSPLWMEIGFGGGEHLAAQARLHPDIRFIGCEPFINGVASLIDHLELGGIDNVRVFNDDARLMLDALPVGSLDRCFVLFADPWPKKRHAERRFIGAENIARIGRALKPGGMLRLASDHPVLIAHLREQMAAAADFTCTHHATEPPADWVETRYQQKAVAAGRVPVFMDYQRKPTSAA
ncbi:MAG: tRNA (guanosine(46)-N7)-methyltransferase TrmB [Alphaproteobacteria bacterium]|nr:tRNA (guanosine(46)-N7)-methyltransferase TrmB [Alphaproteobacteria bacterium]